MTEEDKNDTDAMNARAKELVDQAIADGNPLIVYVNHKDRDTHSVLLNSVSVPDIAQLRRTLIRKAPEVLALEELYKGLFENEQGVVQ